MTADDLMVKNVVTVRPEASVQDIASSLLANRISAVPVVTEKGELVGIVSESDLLHRVESGTERRRSRWFAFLAGTETLAHEYVKSHGRTAADIMTQPVITASPKLSLNELAHLLESRRIKRVPIVDRGKLVGIVSRADLVRAFATAAATAPHPALDDATLRERVIAKINAEPWARPSLVNVIVHNGNVELIGIVASQAEKVALRVLTEVTPGVKSVTDNLTVRAIEAWA